MAACFEQAEIVTAASLRQQPCVRLSHSTLVLAVTLLALLSLNPLLAQSARQPVSKSDAKPAAIVNAQFSNPELNWIPAISIQADDIDLLLQDQSPLSAGSQNQRSKQTSQGHAKQLILRLLPEPNSIISTGYSWSLLGGSSDNIAGLTAPRLQAVSGTQIGSAYRSQNANGLILRQNEAFKPQLNLGWQLDLQQPGPLGNQFDNGLLLSNFSAQNVSGQNLPGSDNMALANIQCAESVLTRSSYSASGCRFTRVNQQQLLLGLDWTPMPGLSTTASIFESNQSSRPGWEQYNIGASSLAAARLGNASASDLLAVSGQTIQGLQIGLQLDLFNGSNNNVDISAGWSRITDFQLDAPFLDIQPGQANGLNQTSMLQTLGLSELSSASASASNSRFTRSDVLDSASLQVNWSNGAFSSGLQSVYQQTPVLPGIRRGEDLTTFNLHFTWQTPWQGALSIGANNLLDTTGTTATDLEGEEAISSIYGRIPYVRYKQDL